MTAPDSTPTSQPPSSRAGHGESRSARAGRHRKRAYLYGWTTVLLALLVLLVVLVVENTRSVKVGWIFGYSHISLVFLVLFSTLLGWVLGVATSVLFRRRTRIPR
jgi:uncharacterized integral membrane protein